jgi:hypothetical protein
VAESGEPTVVKRYRKGIVAIVPLWEWRFFKELEADIRAGRKRIIDVEESPEIELEMPGTVADQPVTDCPDAGRRSPRQDANPERENDDEDEQGNEERDHEEGQDAQVGS